MPTTLPIEMYDMLEKRVGKEEARDFGKLLTASFDAIEKKAETVVIQKKAEIKEELTKELVTKEDLAKLEGRLNEKVAAVKEDLVKLEGRLNEKITAVALSTKEDLAKLEGRLNEKVAAVKEDLAKLEGRLNEKINAVKEDLVRVEGRLNERFTAMDWKMRVYFLILLFVMLLNNPKVLDLVAKLFGVAIK
ncbi:MAG: hypothetical protein HQK95_00915 [Nitrospirae bacterium]|nr:hypothetical protein [Nitrospirota bacterium]